MAGGFGIQNVGVGPAAPFTFGSAITNCGLVVSSAVAVPSIGVPAVCAPTTLNNPSCIGAGVGVYPGTVTITWAYAGARLDTSTTTSTNTCTVAMPPPFGVAGCGV